MACLWWNLCLWVNELGLRYISQTINAAYPFRKKAMGRRRVASTFKMSKESDIAFSTA